MKYDDALIVGAGYVERSGKPDRGLHVHHVAGRIFRYGFELDFVANVNFGAVGRDFDRGRLRSFCGFRCFGRFCVLRARQLAQKRSRQLRPHLGRTSWRSSCTAPSEWKC